MIAVHHLAVVDPTSRVGARSVVRQFGSVVRGAVIGEDCSIAPGAVVDGAMVGDRCRIGQGASINPGVRIDSDVFVGPGAVLCNDMWPSVSREGFPLEDLASGNLVVVWVQAFAVIGARAIVLPGAVVGAGSVIAAGAIVDRNVPADMLWHRTGAVYPLPSCRERNRIKVAAA